MLGGSSVEVKCIKIIYIGSSKIKLNLAPLGMPKYRMNLAHNEPI